MKKIENKEFEGERPLYQSHDLHIDHVTIHKGESSIKECSNILATNCQFEGKYVFWETYGFKVKDCLFTEGARSSLWYSKDVEMTDCRVEAPKMFRRMQGIKLNNVQILNGQETLWDCSDIELQNVEINGADYLGMHAENVKADHYHQEGNYAFQYGKNICITNSLLNSKDAFWEAENITLIDCEINGEYLGWYSKNLHLIRCKVTGTQPLCYCENLIMEDCTLGDDADLAFEYSTIEATLNGHVVSIKNPTSGTILADSIGEIIIDENCKAPANCSIQTR